MNANGGSSNRRPRRPRDATRPPSRRSTRETAGRPPDYDRSAQDDDRSKDTPAEREREPAPRRSAWNARPLVLGEIIPPGTADRVRGYLERIAEKEDFVYVRAGGVAWRGCGERLAAWGAHCVVDCVARAFTVPSVPTSPRSVRCCNAMTRCATTAAAPAPGLAPGSTPSAATPRLATLTSCRAGTGLTPTSRARTSGGGLWRPGIEWPCPIFRRTTSCEAV